MIYNGSSYVLLLFIIFGPNIHWVDLIAVRYNQMRLMKISTKIIAGTFAFATLAFANGGAYALDAGDLLETLERGLWRLRPASGTSSALPIDQYCVGDPTLLAQLQHGSATCTQTVLRSSANSVTISYNCRGKGQGITVIRKETNRLIQIQSQGTWNNSPFSFTAEARRAGTC